MSRLRLSAFVIALTIATVAPIFAPAVRAADFNPYFILSDREMRDYQAMSYGDILLFLSEKGGLNDARAVRDPGDGEIKGAAKLIYDVSQRYQINPKYLLALIQKESSAVETSKPTSKQLDWATGYGVCDSCRKTDPQVKKYQGLAKQVDAAASWMDWYLGLDQAAVPIKAGEQRTIDKTAVTPINKTTAALYAYTPHVHGNRLLWSIWNRWFGEGAKVFNFPEGTLLRNSQTGGVVVVQNGQLRPILSRAVLYSRFNAAHIIDLNQYDFGALMDDRRGSPIRFPDFSLIRVEDGRTYLLVGSQKRLFVSDEAFARLGFNPEEVINASAADVADYADGLPLDDNAAPPSGELVREGTDGQIWYVEDGAKREFLDAATPEADFPERPIRQVTDADLADLKEGPPMGLTDGVLAKTADSPVVFVIADGFRRPIKDEDSFNAFGYRWSDIVTVSKETLGLHEEGDLLAFSNEAAP